MTVDFTEGTDLTLSCNNPGNTGTTRYQWFDSTGNSRTSVSTNPPLPLPLNNIQRQSSGLYICQSVNVLFLQSPLLSSDTSIRSGRA